MLLCAYGWPLPTLIQPSHGSPLTGCGLVTGGISRLSARAAASAGEKVTITRSPRHILELVAEPMSAGSISVLRRYTSNRSMYTAKTCLP